jgi:40S ribosome biogenesis protein Tsr1 and BMS1 C-terminal
MLCARCLSSWHKAHELSAVLLMQLQWGGVANCGCCAARGDVDGAAAATAARRAPQLIAPNCHLRTAKPPRNCRQFERFLQAGRFCGASVYGPATFQPAPVLLFKETLDGATGAVTALQLVATGTLLGVDPDRIILKKIVLTGYPLRSATWSCGRSVCVGLCGLKMVLLGVVDEPAGGGSRPHCTDCSPVFCFYFSCIVIVFVITPPTYPLRSVAWSRGR